MEMSGQSDGLAAPCPRETLLIVVSNVACSAIGADRTEITAFQTVHWHAGRCLATAVVSLFLSWWLPGNGSIRRNHTKLTYQNHSAHNQYKLDFRVALKSCDV
jgi:hypothetical protein